MGNRCRICDHSERAKIELGLARRVSLNTLARKFDVSKDAIWRHKRNHFPPQLEAALVATGAPSAIDLEQLRQSESEGLLQSVVVQRARLYALVDKAEEFDDVRAAASVHGRITDNLTLAAKLVGELNTHHHTTINQLVISPEYLDLRGDLISALAPFPEARRAVAKVLREREGAEPHFTGIHPGPQIEHDDHVGQ